MPNPKAKLLTSMPTAGTLPEKHFGPTHTGSLWVEFEEQDYSKWVGSFASGDSECNKVVSVPGSDVHIVVAGGFAYVVDADTQALLASFGENIEDLMYVSTSRLIVYAEPSWFAIRSLDKLTQEQRFEHTEYFTRLKFTGSQGRTALGLADWMSNDWNELPFRFDIDTGQLEIGQ